MLIHFTCIRPLAMERSAAAETSRAITHIEGLLRVNGSAMSARASATSILDGAAEQIGGPQPCMEERLAGAYSPRDGSYLGHRPSTIAEGVRSRSRALTVSDPTHEIFRKIGDPPCRTIEAPQRLISLPA